jgi:dienelactone hydrolase
VKSLSPFAILLLVLTFEAWTVGQDNNPGTESGGFVTVKQDDGSEFRAFVAGPADAKAGVLVVHDYFGISDATQQFVKHLGTLGYRAVAIDLYGGRSATRHEEAVKLIQSLDRKKTDRILQAGLDYLKRPGRKLATIGFSMGAQESLNFSGKVISQTSRGRGGSESKLCG